MLMDSWCLRHTGNKYDKDATFAKTGKISDELLNQLMNERYLAQPAPKSTGRELFNLPWLDKQLSQFDLAAEDVQRTLCEYTAQTIANEVERYAFGPQPELLVCGGGARNPLVMERLAALLPNWSVAPNQRQRRRQRLHGSDGFCLACLSPCSQFAKQFARSHRSQ